MSLEEKKKTESKEKDKALSLVLGQIERNFGRGSIMRLGDASRMKVETIIAPLILIYIVQCLIEFL